MIRQVGFALRILSISALASARPDILRARTPPNSNTCACGPVSESGPSTTTIISAATTTSTVVTTATITSTDTRTETVRETTSVIKETTGQSQTLTITLTRTQPPVTETVYVSNDSSIERVTVTCTEIVSEMPDGSVVTETKAPGGEQSSWSISRGGAETHSTHHGGEAPSTSPASGTASYTPSSEEGKPTSTPGRDGDKPGTGGDKPGNGGQKPPHGPGGGDGGDHHSPRPIPSEYHCKHWDGSRCVKPTMSPDLPVTSASTRDVASTTPAKPSTTSTTAFDAQPSISMCSVSVAFVTVYNTVTATVYQETSASVTSSFRQPRAPAVTADAI